MVIAWLRSLLIFDGFLAPNSTATVPRSKSTGASWFHQLLVLDGFIDAEREVRSATQVPVEVQVSQSPTVSLPATQSSAPEIAVDAGLSENSFSEILTTADKPEISSYCEEAITDWQRVLGWKD